MKSSLLAALVAALAIAFAAGAAPVAAADAEASVAPAAGEPVVRHTVIEDGRARIDEVRVRGQLQRVTVEPKGRAPSYEIITGDGSHDLSDGTNASRGATGKRVWNVLRF